MALYYYNYSEKPGTQRSRYHRDQRCRMVGMLMGLDLRVGVSPDWYRASKCAVCGLPLAQQPKPDGDLCK